MSSSIAWMHLPDETSGNLDSQISAACVLYSDAHPASAAAAIAVITSFFISTPLLRPSESNSPLLSVQINLLPLMQAFDCCGAALVDD